MPLREMQYAGILGKERKKVGLQCFLKTREADGAEKRQPSDPYSYSHLLRRELPATVGFTLKSHSGIFQPAAQLVFLHIIVDSRLACLVAGR